MAKRVVIMPVLPNQPLDGSGRVCIHLFVPDENGPFVEGHVTDHVKKTVGPVHGRLACSSRKTVAPTKNSMGHITITPRTNDARAVTCQKCCESPEYRHAMELAGDVVK